MKSESAQAAFKGTPLHAFTSSGWSEVETAAAGEFWKVGRSIAEALGLRDTLPHLLVNGRVSLMVHHTAQSDSCIS